MKPIEKLVRFLIALLVAALVLYLSKPDRGGLERCARIFAIPELKQLQISSQLFGVWEPFESAKFRFRILPSDFSKLDSTLKATGYSKWERGGVSFGSVSTGWTMEEDHVYCKLTRNGYHYYWSYSAKENLIYAISFPT